MSAKVVSFISEKGGVGKTTACYHIAAGLQRFYKKRVLILDTDYQRGGITCRVIPSMLEHFKKGKVPSDTLYSVFRAIYTEAEIDDIPTLDIVTGEYKLQIVPSDPRLEKVTLDKLPGGNGFTDRNEQLFIHLSAVANAICPFKSDYDYILIDTHPEISDLLNSVIFASDYCVSPVKLDEQSSVGVPSTIEAIKQVNKTGERLASLELGSFVATKFAGAIGMMAREYDGDLIYSMKQQYNKIKSLHRDNNNKQDGIFVNYVTEGDGIRNAAAQRLAVFDMDGNVAEKQSAQFIAVIKEFIARCK